MASAVGRPPTAYPLHPLPNTRQHARPEEMKEMKKLWDKVEKVSEKVIAATKQKDPSGTLVGKSIKVGIYTVRLESIIGEGGYACIYKARDINTGDVFALKHLRISPDAESAELVQREARTMSRLRGHPNILRLHAAAFLGPAGAETECFMLMEYCPNTLLDLLHKTSFQLDEATILDVFTAVCEGVCHMHRQNPPLTHRYGWGRPRWRFAPARSLARGASRGRLSG